MRRVTSLVLALGGFALLVFTFTMAVSEPVYSQNGLPFSDCEAREAVWDLCRGDKVPYCHFNEGYGWGRTDALRERVILRLTRRRPRSARTWS